MTIASLWTHATLAVQAGITGDAVVSLQGTFIENWLQASEEVLNGLEYFPDGANAGPVTSLVVNSTPSVGGSTRARILFQTLLASAKQSIQITTPYFMPDESVRKELISAIKNRGVQVTVLTAGDHNDHWLSDAAKASARKIMPCVSRARCTRLVLDR